MIVLDVNTLDLRQALQAVIPHAATNDDIPELAAVHFTATDNNLFLTATNRYSLGHAIASVWEYQGLVGDTAADSFDLRIDVAKELLALFKAHNKQPDDEIGDCLRITVEDDTLTFLDVAGLFPGKMFRIPRSDAAEYPISFGSLLLGAMVSESCVPSRIATQGKYLRLFASAAAAYGEPLLIEPTDDEKKILISCGESFIGLLMPVRSGDDSEIAGKLAGWRAGWLDRLPEIAFTKAGR